MKIWVLSGTDIDDLHIAAEVHTTRESAEASALVWCNAALERINEDTYATYADAKSAIERIDDQGGWDDHYLPTFEISEHDVPPVIVTPDTRAVSAHSFAVTLHVAAEEIGNAFCTAFEGGYSPWLDDCGSPSEPRLIRGDTDPKDECIFWGQDCFWKSDFAFELTYDLEEGEEGERGGKITIDRAAVVRGLGVLVKENPELFGRIIAGGGDAFESDEFVQYCVFGKAVYG